MNSNWTTTGFGLIVRNKTLVSDGEQDWSSRLELSPDAQKILSPPHFQPTTGTEYKLGILPGYLFPDDRRTSDYIRVIATECTFSGWQLHSPHLEVAGLARGAITDDEIRAIGLSRLVFMHLPVLIDGDPSLLNARRFDDGRWLFTCFDKPDRRWSRESGFAFVVSQVQN